ncbi:lysM and putative peptidoglycan-binding domain-containing protein 3 isoform X2 [Orussus abietinus]|nr:lysM and putative peptidoglycan-binding domain-containing protein 3 isoform X2 [Orussus abietinus]XP_023288482.1 lysM and putative peptidoglycan-binding domain-containing protein 3 isoform X2 [Orussus abietinus]
MAVRSSPRKVEVINVVINPNDTLQALALRYRCTISELKRINKIHKENEIYAHRLIKVPVQPFSILTETLSQNPNTTENKVVKDDEDNRTSEQREEQIINLLASPATPSTSRMGFNNINDINDIILNSTCEPLSLFTNGSLEMAEETENDRLLERDHSTTTGQSRIVDTFKCSGADWGLSWAQLLGVSLLLGFAGPIIYILYLAEYPKHPVTSGH